MTLPYNTLNKEIYQDIILDSGQTFSGFENSHIKKATHFYEIDVSCNNLITSEKHPEFLESLVLFEKEGKKYQSLETHIHYTRMSDKNSVVVPFYFKLTIATDKKVPLKTLVKEIEYRININSTPESMTIVKKRIVKNDKKVNFDVYFEHLSKHIESNYKGFTEKILVFSKSHLN
jgi:hypothetical protein